MWYFETTYGETEEVGQTEPGREQTVQRDESRKARETSPKEKVHVDITADVASHTPLTPSLTKGETKDRSDKDAQSPSLFPQSAVSSTGTPMQPSQSAALTQKKTRKIRNCPLVFKKTEPPQTLGSGSVWQIATDPDFMTIKTKPRRVTSSGGLASSASGSGEVSACQTESAVVSVSAPPPPIPLREAVSVETETDKDPFHPQLVGPSADPQRRPRKAVSSRFLSNLSTSASTPAVSPRAKLVPFNRNCFSEPSRACVPDDLSKPGCGCRTLTDCSPDKWVQARCALTPLCSMRTEKEEVRDLEDPSGTFGKEGEEAEEHKEKGGEGGDKLHVCRFWTVGKCKRGNKCPFSHPDGITPLAGCLSGPTHNRHFKTSMCPMLKNGKCSRSAAECKYAHSLAELRSTADLHKTVMCSFWLSGHCKAGSNCRHAHGDRELRKPGGSSEGSQTDQPEAAPSALVFGRTASEEVYVDQQVQMQMQKATSPPLSLSVSQGGASRHLSPPLTETFPPARASSSHQLFPSLLNPSGSSSSSSAGAVGPSSAGSSSGSAGGGVTGTGAGAGLSLPSNLPLGPYVGPAASATAGPAGIFSVPQCQMVWVETPVGLQPVPLWFLSFMQRQGEEQGRGA
uniref:C3H1-type domain-containing protein n=1 Tax=Chromera velia CCMP2878 TaxID=1169474 RepID=A0A0G4HXA0_9ALVE|eukprot:Cvel_9229.t1-p1 / transcript=Cvel_9229.t1 / gene=Cvel_9229 / organism=Chromera_velia_CCMP2878 / gene_product=Cleavage and polyadenylation specificity factor, putative / transcript_product=Cleavage and polyadenylation specificity factor, putative / location=Cvel_scaffold526:69192-71576(-) / protein_length=625 / sequence_SO=supercontig / SO=protein_coding / is_pseudo=false